jgi:hypothetical protein
VGMTVGGAPTAPKWFWLLLSDRLLYGHGKLEVKGAHEI